MYCITIEILFKLLLINPLCLLAVQAEWRPEAARGDRSSSAGGPQDSAAGRRWVEDTVRRGC